MLLLIVVLLSTYFFSAVSDWTKLSSRWSLRILWTTDEKNTGSKWKFGIINWVDMWNNWQLFSLNQSEEACPTQTKWWRQFTLTAFPKPQELQKTSISQLISGNDLTLKKYSNIPKRFWCSHEAVFQTRWYRGISQKCCVIFTWHMMWLMGWRNQFTSSESSIPSLDGWVATLYKWWIWSN